MNSMGQQRPQCVLEWDLYVCVRVLYNCNGHEEIKCWLQTYLKDLCREGGQGDDPKV